MCQDSLEEACDGRHEDGDRSAGEVFGMYISTVRSLSTYFSEREDVKGLVHVVRRSF